MRATPQNSIVESNALSSAMELNFDTFFLAIDIFLGIKATISHNIQK
jgi:hypothetical protein